MEDEKKIFESPHWIQNYNLYTMNESIDPIPVNELHTHVNNVCFKYIQSIVWTTQYYFNQCISQEWLYPYEHAPTLYDLNIYLLSNKRVTVKEDLQPYTPIEQLHFVFPIQSYPLCKELKQDDRKQIQTIDKEFTLLKRYDWECHPVFPITC